MFFCGAVSFRSRNNFESSVLSVNRSHIATLRYSVITAYKRPTLDRKQQVVKGFGRIESALAIPDNSVDNHFGGPFFNLVRVRSDYYFKVKRAR